MLLDLIKKEMLDHLLSLRFAITCMMCLAVIVTSTVVLTKDYKEDLQDYHSNTVMHRNEILGAEQVFQLRERMHVDKPLNRMKIFIKGINPENTETVKIRGAPEFQASYERNPISALFPTVDLAFFVGIIMSLLALCFSYDAVSGEKESGTLKLMMSYSVPRDVVVLGKWIGGYIMLVTPFLISVCFGLILALTFPEVHLVGEDWLALAALVVVSLLYISAMYSLGLFISTRTAMASTSVIVLFLVWVVGILVIPNLSPYVASQLSPAPSIESVEHQKTEIEKEAQRKSRKIWADPRYSEEVKRTFGNMTIMTREVNEEGKKLMAEISREAGEAQKKVMDSFTNALNRQISVSKHLSRVSPLSSFAYSACDISATGDNEQKAFVKAVGQYGETWGQYVGELWRKFWEAGEGSSSPRDFGDFDVSDYPRFVYNGIPFGDRFEEIVSDLLLLVIWNVLFFMASYLSFLRYDVT